MIDRIDLLRPPKERFRVYAETALWGMARILGNNHDGLRYTAVESKDNGDVTFLGIARNLNAFITYTHIPIRQLGIFTCAHYDLSTSGYMKATAGILDTDTLRLRRAQESTVTGEEENSLSFDLYDGFAQTVENYDPAKLAEVIEIGLQKLADAKPH